MAPQNEPQPPAEEVVPEAPAVDLSKADQYGVIVEHNVDDPNYKEFVAPSLNK
jgi:hypothetical protein